MVLISGFLFIFSCPIDLLSDTSVVVMAERISKALVPGLHLIISILFPSHGAAFS